MYTKKIEYGYLGAFFIKQWVFTAEQHGLKKPCYYKKKGGCMVSILITKPGHSVKDVPENNNQ